MTQHLTIPDFPPPDVARALSPNGRAHWARKRGARMVVAHYLNAALTQHPWQPVAGKARLTIRWVFPQHRKRDMDNHSTGVSKALLDVLVLRGILAGDDSAHLELRPVEIVVVPGQRWMELFLESADA